MGEVIKIDSSLPDNEQSYYREQPTPVLRIVGSGALEVTTNSPEVAGDGLPYHVRIIEAPITNIVEEAIS